MTKTNKPRIGRLAKWVKLAEDSLKSSNQMARRNKRTFRVFIGFMAVIIICITVILYNV